MHMAVPHRLTGTGAIVNANIAIGEPELSLKQGMLIVNEREHIALFRISEFEERGLMALWNHERMPWRHGEGITYGEG
jgi:hypothetical protein